MELQTPITRDVEADQTPEEESPRRKKGQRGPQRRRRRTYKQRNLDFCRVIAMVPLMAFSPDQPYGDGIEPKPDGVVHLAYGNIDGFSTVPFNNPKANVLKYWLRDIEADFFAGNEAKINWSLMPCLGSLTKIFRSENALHTMAAYNTHENFSRRQYGGTFQLTFGLGPSQPRLCRLAWMSATLDGLHGRSLKAAMDTSHALFQFTSHAALAARVEI
jgi:hypothetical protein